MVDRAAAGEEIIIAKNGQRLARLVPLATRKLGHLRGMIVLDAEIEKPLDDETLRLFEEGHPGDPMRE